MRRLPLLVAAIAVVVVVIYLRTETHEPPSRERVAPPPGTSNQAGCDAFASPGGSDGGGDGSLGRPFQSPARLESALRPGQTSCLRGGRYGGTGSVFDLNAGG